jgi:putative transposase
LHEFNGRVARAYAARRAVLAGRDRAMGIPIAPHLITGWQDSPPVSRSVFYAAFRREMSPAERAYWRHGANARADHRTYLERTIAHRNACWQTDHMRLDITILSPRGLPFRPWLTTFFDLYSRVILGWAIGNRADSGSVTTALRSALICNPEIGNVGGVPQVIECDHGRDFTAKVIRRAVNTLGSHLFTVATHSGRAKGGIERLHGTIGEMFLAQLPGYTHGPRDKRGRLYGPVPDDKATLDKIAQAAEDARRDGPDAVTGEDPPPMLPYAVFCDLFDRWAQAYNSEHTHSELHGNTPLQVWNADPTEISVIDPEHLRDLLKERKGAKITGRGIRHENLHYVSDETQGRVSDRVTIRFTPHDNRFIEVYELNGTHISTAFPSDGLSPDQKTTRDDAWNAETRRLAAERRAATRRAKSRLAPLTHESVTAGTHPADPQNPANPGDAGYDAGGVETVVISKHASHRRSPTAPA